MQLSLEVNAATSFIRSLDLDRLHLTMKSPFNGAISYHADCDLTAERVVPFSSPFLPIPRSLVQ